MADPLVQKISLLEAQVDEVVAADEVIMNDISEPVLTKYTKRVRFDKIKLFLANQLTDGMVANSKLADGSVTSGKLGSGSVIAGKIAAGGVSAATQIASGIITATQMASGAAVGNIATGAIAGTKLADEAVTETKLGAIKRMIMIPVFGLEDAVIVKNFTRIMAWHPDLNGHIVTGAWAALLGAVSGSGTVAISLINAGGTMCSISIPQSGWSAQSGTINTSYDDVASLATFSVNVTAQGSGAKGLTIYLEVVG